MTMGIVTVIYILIQEKIVYLRVGKSLKDINIKMSVNNVINVYLHVWLWHILVIEIHDVI